MQSPESIKQLKQLYLENHRERYPNLPEYARVAPKYTDKDANSLTKCIIDYIRITGGQAERISVTGRKISQKKTYTDILGNRKTIGSDRWIKSSMKKGSADISATINGRAVKIEVKIGKDKQSQAQIEYQKQVEAAGGIYIIVKSYDDFIIQLKEINLKTTKIYKNGTI
jgi:hypothetical protein